MAPKKFTGKGKSTPAAEPAQAEPEAAGAAAAEPEEEAAEPEEELEENEPEAPEEAPAAAAAEDADPFAHVSTDELYARASVLKIKGRRMMSRRALILAIQEAELAGVVPEVDEPGEPPPEVDEKPREATQAQAQKIFAAPTAQLELVVADPKFPDYLKRVVVQELARRANALKEKTDLAARIGPMERYVVTKGGRYITRDGFPTHLTEGSLVTPLTHDLKDVERQGIVFQPARVVATRHDELGNQRTEIR